jgi:hypothetical protein
LQTAIGLNGEGTDCPLFVAAPNFVDSVKEAEGRVNCEEGGIWRFSDQTRLARFARLKVELKSVDAFTAPASVSADINPDPLPFPSAPLFFAFLARQKMGSKVMG